MRHFAFACIVLTQSMSFADAGPRQESAAQPPALAPASAAQPDPDGEPAPTELPTLIVGDPAPVLRMEKWIAGAPVEGFRAGHVYVVEFWATWCEPSRESIAVLSELQAAHGENVTVLGVAFAEQNGSADVETFLAVNPTAVRYTVAYDDNAATNTAWMEAAQLDSIPTAFIVNGDGRVAWIGHPMDGLDRVLAKVVGKSHDIEAAAARARRQRELIPAVVPLVARLQEAYSASDFNACLATLDEIVALDPDVLGEWSATKFQILLAPEAVNSPERAYAHARAALDTAVAKNPEAAHAFAYLILSMPGVKERDLDVALRAASLADEAAGHENPFYLETLARVRALRGDRPGAIAAQELAAGLLKGTLRGEAERFLAELKAGTAVVAPGDAAVPNPPADQTNVPRSGGSNAGGGGEAEPEREPK